jgi:PEP-CTERM motif
MRCILALLLPAALQASAVTSVDQIADLFCGELPGCWNYPVLPPQLPPVPEAPGYTLGPYVSTLYLDGSPVSGYSGTLFDFESAITGENAWSNDGYSGFEADLFYGYLGETGYSFEMLASPELISSINSDPPDPTPEPSTFILAGLGAALIGIALLRRAMVWSMPGAAQAQGRSHLSRVLLARASAPEWVVEEISPDQDRAAEASGPGRPY